MSGTYTGSAPKTASFKGARSLIYSLVCISGYVETPSHTTHPESDAQLASLCLTRHPAKLALAVNKESEGSELATKQLNS